jgi:broad specificity phosphatase PhoE
MAGLTRRLFLAALVAAGVAFPAAAQDGPVVVYLVRHAEKANDSRDPPLSEAGKARATELARVLGNAGLTQVWTTDFDRTRSTAAPAAAAAGLSPQLYDPSKAREFAEQLRHTPGRHLVVGHSNTTPGLVELLGGTPGTPISDTEYDRLYIVVLNGTGAVTSLLRYGAPASR